MQIYLALLGFFSDTKSELQTIIEKHTNTNVSWVAATDERLQGVVINANFLSASMVDDYIGRSRVNIVCCYSDEDGKQQALDRGIPSLSSKQHTPQELKSWLTHLLGGACIKLDASERGKEADSQSKTSSVKIKSEISESNITTVQETAINDDYKLLLSHIKEEGGYYLVQYDSDTVWVNAKDKLVYLSFPQKNIKSIETSRWSTLSEFNPPSEARKLQLELWLFETLWQSSEVEVANEVDENGLYKLVYWPRPLCANGRSEALRLGAFIQAASASVSSLQDKTGYEIPLVKRFLFAGLSTGQIKQTGMASDKKEPEVKKTVDKEKVGLLNRIRAKFGLR